MLAKIRARLNARRYAKFTQAPTEPAVPKVPHLFAVEGKFFQRAYVQGSQFHIEQGEVLPDGEQRVLAIHRMDRTTPRPLTLEG